LGEERNELTLRAGKERLGWPHRDNVLLLPP
jgi:hypothetical protein